jgi:hypothetical protein
MSESNPQTNQKPTPANPSIPAPKVATPAPPLAKTVEKESEGPLLFHFAECTNCHHLLPISTTTEKYFAILSKDPNKPVGLGEKCMRCGADSWKLVTG